MVYEVQVVVVNGAGVRSPVLTSTQMFVVKGNVAGVVLDGRSDTDQDFTNDRSALFFPLFTLVEIKGVFASGCLPL